MIQQINNHHIYHIYHQVLESKETIIISEPRKDMHCLTCEKKFLCKEELEISTHIKLILTDFGANNTADVPEGFLQEILKILKVQRDLLANNKKYKLKLNEEKLKELEYLNQKMVREISDGVIKVSYA